MEMEVTVRWRYEVSDDPVARERAYGTVDPNEMADVDLDQFREDYTGVLSALEAVPWDTVRIDVDPVLEEL